MTPPPPPPPHTHTNTCDGIVTSIRQLDQVVHVQLGRQSDTALCKLGIMDGAREDQQQETRNGCRVAKGGGRNLKEGGEQRNSNGHWEGERGKGKNL